jgi:hypothetical protein
MAKCVVLRRPKKIKITVTRPMIYVDNSTCQGNNLAVTVFRSPRSQGEGVATAGPNATKESGF